MSTETTVDTSALREAAKRLQQVMQMIETAFVPVPAATQAPVSANSGYQTSAALLVLLGTQLVTAVKQLVADTGGHSDRLRATATAFHDNESVLGQHLADVIAARRPGVG